MDDHNPYVKPIPLGISPTMTLRPSTNQQTMIAGHVSMGSPHSDMITTSPVTHQSQNVQTTTTISSTPQPTLGLLDHRVESQMNKNPSYNPTTITSTQLAILERGPRSHSRLLAAIVFSWWWIVMAILLVANIVLAIFEMLDGLTVGFMRPIIPLIFHIVLFFLFLILLVLVIGSFFHERLLEDKLQIPFLAGHLCLYNLFGSIIFLIWTGTFGSINQTVEFSKQPRGYISIVAITSALFIWFVAIMIAWTLMCVNRRNQHKTLEILNYATAGTLTAIMKNASLSDQHTQ